MIVCLPVQTLAQSTPTNKKKKDKMTVTLKPVKKAAPKVARAAPQPVRKRVVAPVAPRPAPVSNNDNVGWNHAVGTYTRTVRAMLDPSCTTNCQPFAEALGLAVDSQYLIVPWKFISDTVMTHPQTRLMVENQDPQIVDIDVASNLALLRTERPLIPSLSRGQIRQSDPSADEALYSLSSRNQLNQDSHYVSTKADGPNKRYVIQTTGPMSEPARYYFDHNGNLAAIGSTLDDSSSGRSVYDLLRKQDGPQPASVSGRDQRRRQLYSIQDRWTQILGPSKSTFSTSQLNCKPDVPTIPDSRLAAKVHDAHMMSCESKIFVPVEADYLAGLQIYSGDVNMRVPASDSETHWPQAFGRDFFADLDHDSAKVNLMTAPLCNESTITNSHSQQVQVRFCTSALKVEAGLNDTAIAFATGDPGRTRVVLVRLKGFTKDNTHKIVEALVENVGSLK